MIDYQKYINALRKCAKEHESDRTSTGHIIVSDLCRDTANFLDTLEQITELKEVTELKEAYQKGYKDGQEALAFHLELCKEEGSIIEIPKKVTNGNVMLKLFPNSKYKVVDNGIEFKGIIDDNTEFTTWFPIEWWNSPYRKEN